MPRRRGSGAQGRGVREMEHGLYARQEVRTCSPAESFFALARRVFGLSFEEWHQRGLVDDRYVPYTMV
jgi:hypothetical protein